MSFIKRHKILFILFAVSIFLMIKNSSIPYFFAPPAIISFIFDVSKSDFFSGMAQMIDISHFCICNKFSFLLYGGLSSCYKTRKES